MQTPSTGTLRATASRSATSMPRRRRARRVGRGTPALEESGLGEHRRAVADRAEDLAALDRRARQPVRRAIAPVLGRALAAVEDERVERLDADGRVEEVDRDARAVH